DARREFILALSLQVSRITHYGEIWAAAYFVGGVYWIVHSLVEVGGCRQCQVAACRESDHADAGRIDAPFRRAVAYDADRSLSVEQWTKRWFATNIARPPGHTVLENDPSRADRIQPYCHFLSLELPKQIVVSPSRTYQHRRSRVLLLGWPVDGDC